MKVAGVRFRRAGKVYPFTSGELEVTRNQRVIVETSWGPELGTVVYTEDRPDPEKPGEMRKVLRLATAKDLEMAGKFAEREPAAFKICEEKIAKRNLPMKLVAVEYTFDGSKILFYFTADNRVDFRELVKDLAGVFRTRIELRQIGVRDEAKMLGGLGMCGRPFCCSSYMGDFQPVTIKMAKEQGLSLNPVKISGTCGRLMCCLKYEQESYEHLLAVTPKVGAVVDTKEGRGTVTEANLLTGILKVQLERNPNAAPVSVHRRDARVLKDGRIRVDKAELDALKGIE